MTVDQASSPRRAGFTLVELLAVTAIIAILAGIVLGISGFATKKSDRAKALGDIERIKTALEEYRIENGQYWTKSGPIDTTGSDGFSNKVGVLIAGGIRINDPWGRPYEYEAVGAQPIRSYRLYSKGASTTVTSDDVDSSSGTY